MITAMKILVAEDESSISMQYELVLKERGHTVVITENGEECLSTYISSLQSRASTYPTQSTPTPPFDLVVLDYRMPKMDGLDAAIRILDLCLQKPFDLEYFVDAVEDKALYEQLERLNVRVRALKDHNVTHSQLLGLLAGVQRLHEMVLRD
jgi:two-component system cell cycle response regulator CpdR